MLVGPAPISQDKSPDKTNGTSQPEIFSEKPKPSKCIDNIQIQQNTMVKELKKIRSLLKKKKKD